MFFKASLDNCKFDNVCVRGKLFTLLFVHLLEDLQRWQVLLMFYISRAVL